MQLHFESAMGALSLSHSYLNQIQKKLIRQSLWHTFITNSRQFTHEYAHIRRHYLLKLPFVVRCLETLQEGTFYGCTQTSRESSKSTTAISQIVYPLIKKQIVIMFMPNVKFWSILSYYSRCIELNHFESRYPLDWKYNTSSRMNFLSTDHQ